jgi:hypothetical protein
MLELEEVVAVWVLRELKKKIRKMWVHPIIGDRRNKGLFWTIFEDLRRDEAKFFNYFRMSVASFEELYETSEHSLKKEKNKYEEMYKYTTHREISSNTQVITVF